MVAELNSKLISRSIFGFELAMDAIFSRSSVVSERVGRFRKVSTNFESSAARAALAGEVVRPRVIRGAFSASMMSCAEGCSAAGAGPTLIGKARMATARAKPRLGRLWLAAIAALPDQTAE